LKRRNYSGNTIKNYLNTLTHFLVWVEVPIEQVTHRQIVHYIDALLDKPLTAKTINCHLNSVRQFYDYLRTEGHLSIDNPVKEGLGLRMPRPLPRYLKDEEVAALLKVVHKPRDRAIFMLMLRSGLRVAEVANLKFSAIDFRRGRIMVRGGKGGKDRAVYISQDALRALVEYLRFRPAGGVQPVFLVDKGTYRGQALSVRGIQKRMEYYARRARLKTSCHHLRHTMATQILNAGAGLVTIQDLLGHSWIQSTQRYCKVSNLKVQQDYYKAMEKLLQGDDGKGGFG
jgi:site-specific recombinase XerD